MKPRQSIFTSSNPAKQAGVRRWDGTGRRSVPWDGLRRDSELWLPDGDCFVHLYERGHSRRGPSFCVPMETLKQATCGNLFSLCFAQKVSRSELPANQLSALEDAPAEMYELYIPAPEDFMREEAFQWHVTTRNFFAFLFRKPVVGKHLGGALIDLQERLNLFRSTEPPRNRDAFMHYASEVGYLNFTHRPDNALAMLFYAEHYELKSLWIDAYAHCVGMNETLYLSPEHEPVPRVTKALITRAHLEMDLHLGRVSKALSSFLDTELSPSNFGLPQGARAHLERFRSFLNSFYVEKFGYWPPPKGTNFSKSLCRSMYYDFRGLYDLLVDMESSESLQSQKPADGGICVLQNVQAFDKRHKFTPLPHPLPLLPAAPPPTSRIQAQKNLVALKLGHKQTKTDKQLLARATLLSATNSNTSGAKAPLVKAYKDFEGDILDKQKEKVSMSDARKVRWILIYATLQMLISVTRAPREVRDTESAQYPLCCLTAGTPPWQNKSDELSASGSDSGYASAELGMLAQATSKSLPATPANERVSYSIRPDCEASDYITHTNQQDAPSISRRPSVSPTIEIPAPLRISHSANSSPIRPSARQRRHSVSVPPLSRTASWRSSIGRSLSPFSSRRNSVRIQPQPWCEIQVPGYGNGLNETILDPPSCVSTGPPSPIIATPLRSASSRRVSLPANLTLNTSIVAHSSAFSPSTEPIVEAEERRSPTLESPQISFDVPAPLRTAAVAPSFPVVRDAVASRRSSSYFHTRVSSEESEPATACASSEAMLRSTSCESTRSSGNNSAAWSPADSSSTHSSPATSITPSSAYGSAPSSPMRHSKEQQREETEEEQADALARTEQLMAELDLEETGGHILRRRSSSLFVAHSRHNSSVCAISAVDDMTANATKTTTTTPSGSRPGTASSNYSKAYRVMGMPEGVGIGRHSTDDQEVVTMYQELAGHLYSP